MTWDERWFRAFGSDAHVIVGGSAELTAWVIDEAERLEQCWSRFRDDAELVQLNRSDHVTVQVSALMIDIAERARDAWRLTGGLFDPTTIGALERAGYRSTFEARGRWSTMPDSTVDPVPAELTGFGTVGIDRAASTITRPVGMRFDWGGIGKGLAADLLAEGLIERGASSAVVGLGGDIRVAGVAPTDGWPIPVEVPGSPGSVWFTHALWAGSIVTSSTRDRRWTAADGTECHHLIDPRTAAPSTSGVAAVIVADAVAWRAEVLAKAALIAGPTRGLAMLADADVTAWMVDDDGRLVDAALTDAALTDAELTHSGVGAAG